MLAGLNSLTHLLSSLTGCCRSAVVDWAKFSGGSYPCAMLTGCLYARVSPDEDFFRPPALHVNDCLRSCCAGCFSKLALTQCILEPNHECNRVWKKQIDYFYRPLVPRRTATATVVHVQYGLAQRPQWIQEQGAQKDDNLNNIYMARTEREIY